MTCTYPVLATSLAFPLSHLVCSQAKSAGDTTKLESQIKDGCQRCDSKRRLSHGTKASHHETCLHGRLHRTGSDSNTDRRPLRNDPAFSCRVWNLPENILWLAIVSAISNAMSN